MGEEILGLGPMTGVRKRSEREKRNISEFRYFVSWHRTIHCSLSFTQSGVLREVTSVIFYLSLYLGGHAVAQSVETQHCNAEGRGFHSR